MVQLRPLHHPNTAPELILSNFDLTFAKGIFMLKGGLVLSVDIVKVDALLFQKNPKRHFFFFEILEIPSMRLLI